MEDLIRRIKERLVGGGYPNEAAISFSVVMPLLRALGWDDSDPEQVMPEYSSGGRRVDFALCGAGKRPSLFIEVKGVGRTLEGDRQLFEYAFHEGIPLCLLTDGREWSFFLPSGQGSYDDRRVYRLQLTDRPPSECARILTRYLDRSRVRTGEAFEDAMRDYRDIASRREAARNIPAAWMKLVEEPEDLLVELVTEQTATISGYRPTSAEVTRFLRSLRVGRDGPAVTTVHAEPQAPRQEREVRLSASRRSKREASGRAVEYELFGVHHHAANASTALVDILTAIAKRNPDKLEDLAIAVRGRSRNHIARTPAEIYPARPDLARAAEIAPGWLVGLNIANREKMRIIREACNTTGLAFGSDVVIDLPNADA